MQAVSPSHPTRSPRSVALREGLLHLNKSSTTHDRGMSETKYADDTQLYIVAKSQSDIKTLEECSTAVRDWFTENGMLLNPDKSEVLLVVRNPMWISLLAEQGCIAGSQITYSVKL